MAMQFGNTLLICNEKKDVCKCFVFVSLCAILLNLLTLLKTNFKNNLGITDSTGNAGNRVFSTNYMIRNDDVIGNNDDVIQNYLKNVSGKQTIDAKDDATKQTESYVSMCSEDLDARRTGNQLFNFAAMLLVARLTNRTAVLPATLKATWLDATFQVRIRRMADDVIYKTICPCYKFRERRSMIYDPRIRMLGGRQMKSLNQKGILLCGYFQSWKYLADIEGELRRQLVFRENVALAAAAYMELNNLPGWPAGTRVTRIGVHVRRGDLLRPDKKLFGYVVPAQSYYRRAVQYFKNKHGRVHLLITSDDPEWARAFFGGLEDDDCRATVSVNNTASVDLAILSMCDGVIMSTGTFGWWGGVASK